MPLTRLIIKNFKSIKNCDISLSELNVLIGENGTGKTNLLDAISYFYRNLTDSDISERVFDENNHVILTILRSIGIVFKKPIK